MRTRSHHDNGSQIRAELVPTVSMLLSIALVVLLAPRVSSHLQETQRVVLLFGLAVGSYAIIRLSIERLVARVPAWRKPTAD